MRIKLNTLKKQKEISKNEKKLFLISILISIGFQLAAQQKLPQLNEKDCFDCELDMEKNLLNIYLENNNSKVLYYSVKGIDQNNFYQISESKRKLIYCVTYKNFPSKVYVYYLDGEKGTIKNIGLFNKGVMTDKTLRYLIYDRVVIEDSMIEPCIVDLFTEKEVYIIKWKSQMKNQEIFGIDYSFSFYRSLENEFDFDIYAEDDSGDICGFARVNVENKKFVEYQEYPTQLINITRREKGLE